MKSYKIGKTLIAVLLLLFGIYINYQFKHAPNHEIAVTYQHVETRNEHSPKKSTVGASVGESSTLNEVFELLKYPTKENYRKILQIHSNCKNNQIRTSILERLLLEDNTMLAYAIIDWLDQSRGFDTIVPLKRYFAKHGSPELCRYLIEHLSKHDALHIDATIYLEDICLANNVEPELLLGLNSPQWGVKRLCLQQLCLKGNLEAYSWAFNAQINNKDIISIILQGDTRRAQSVILENAKNSDPARYATALFSMITMKSDVGELLQQITPTSTLHKDLIDCTLVLWQKRNSIYTNATYDFYESYHLYAVPMGINPNPGHF